jgi:hypothetical protein
LERESWKELLWPDCGWIATTTDDKTEIHAHFPASTVMNDEVVTLGGHLSPEPSPQ